MKLFPGLFLLLLALLAPGRAACAAPEQPTVPTDDGTAAVAALPVWVAPDDERLQYSGRFDFAVPGLARCAWSASAVGIRFRGTAINVNLGVGVNRFEVVVDGRPVKVIASGGFDPGTPPARLYAVAIGLADAEHRVSVWKCTEPTLGDAAFAGFQLNAGAAVLPAPVPRRKIEVIGDSISCGYGNEAAGPAEKFSPATENAYWTYGAIAARAAGADYGCVAWSGRKLYPDNTMQELYDRTLPRDPASHWPGDKQKPDVILVNLCTNDLGARDLPDRAGWVRAYRDFIARLRRDAPGAVIYCALSPMISDDSPGDRPSRTLARQWIGQVVHEANAGGDARVHYLEFELQKVADGIGARWHPSVRTHQIMADKFLAALHADLKW